MGRALKAAVLMPLRFHLLGGLVIVGLVASVISAQVGDRAGFAGSELKRDVMERWGAPIDQPAPSVRFVPSGAVFNALSPLALDRQAVTVEASMSYRKRGLVYFSGFDFVFRGEYEVENRELAPVDLVFVFPVSPQRHQVLLSDLSFQVNGRREAVSLSGQSERLVWTGRAKPGEKLTFAISFAGRGLESFVYRLDPALPVKGFSLDFHVTGGDNYDYPPGVLPAHRVVAEGERAALAWSFASLQAGVPVGLILPSEKSFDSIISTMVRRSWAPFLPLMLGTVCLGLYFRRPLRAWQAYLVAAWYGLFFVLLAYLAAFMSFWAAYALSLAVVVPLLGFYVRSLVSRAAGWLQLGLAGAFLVLPTAAVILEGYTGLVYTLEIALGLAALMVFSTREPFRVLVESVLGALFPKEVSHAP